MKYALILALCYGITMTWLAHEFASENNRLTYDLNVSQTAFKIQSSVVKKVTEENKGLRKANDCLIKYSHRDRCITAIKHTPLPPLVKEK